MIMHSILGQKWPLVWPNEPIWEKRKRIARPRPPHGRMKHQRGDLKLQSQRCIRLLQQQITLTHCVVAHN